MSQLMTYPGYQSIRKAADGQPFFVLRGSSYKDCPFKPQGGHVARDDITDGFADAVCDKLGKGVMYVMSQEQGERTAKKTKTIIGGATNLTATQE